MAAALPHKMEIATEIRKLIGAGVRRKDILDAIQKFKDAPTSMQTMYKIYRGDIAASNADLLEAMGTVVVEAAKAGDWKAAELVLRSKGGWSPTQTVIDAEPEDESTDTSAIDDLLALLGRKSPTKESQ